MANFSCENVKKWTNKEVKPEERIDCAFTIIISSRDVNNFEATLQVQSTRPVFSSTYASPILNLKDNDFKCLNNLISDLAKQNKKPIISSEIQKTAIKVFDFNIQFNKLLERTNSI